MKPFEERVVDEKKELDAKLERLTGFINTAIFKTIGDEEKIRLLRQKNLMTDYSKVLGERIAAFTGSGIGYR